MMLRQGKPKFKKRGRKALVDNICLDDVRSPKKGSSYAKACEQFDIDLAKELAKDAKARRFVTNLSDLIISE